MNGKSDASTSTDDVKDRPLCLFYFTHPFGVLSPEPPTISAAPASVTRAFLNMEPVSPFYWPSSAAASAPGATGPSASGRSSSPGTVRYDLGETRVHHNPVSVVSVSRARRCTVELPRRNSSTISSSLFSSEVWFPTGGGEYPPARRARILPPLRLPSPKDISEYSSDDVWPRKCLGKFSLPPIEMPPWKVAPSRSERRHEQSGADSVGAGAVKDIKGRRKVGVKKQWRRGRGGDVRRVVTRLMRRAITGGGASRARVPQECSASASPALQQALSTIREAWTEPTSLKYRCRVLSRVHAPNSALQRDINIERDSERVSEANAMLTRTQLVELQPRQDASPGLMRRRYSVPETIMRKYRLAQQSSDSEEGASVHATYGECASPPRSVGESPQRHLRRDRELMRKSALLRRMWTRPPCDAPAPPPLACRCEHEHAQETRSLDGSQDELRAAGRRRWDEPRRALPSTADLSCSTFVSHGVAPSSSYVETVDAFSDGTAAADSCSAASASPASETSPPPARDHYDESDTFSTSLSTTKETPGSHERARSDFMSFNGHISGRVSARYPSVENDERNALSTERTVAPFESLEIVVSESTSSPPERRLPAPLAPPAPTARPPPDLDLDVDEYVSRVLVESLASLSDRLDSMPAALALGPERRLSVVEKEIKVRLQNAGVNTIVHLSPTSNNQIIFGNEELCDDEHAETIRPTDRPPRGDTDRVDDLRNEQFQIASRDECNNPPALLRRDTSEDNNNGPLASPPRSVGVAFDAILLQHDNVNGAVLRQIQKLFRDELRLSEETSLRGDSLSHIEISNVDVYLDGSEGGGDTISMRTRADDEPLADVGAGNYYYREACDAALVPRRLAVPHSTSMEVNTSSGSDAERDPLGSDAASLVDSLDDPSSPRRRAGLSRSSVDVLALLPEDARATLPRFDHAEAFFVGIRDDARTPELARVAECLPERIRQKLHRRHRKRELRAECARRGKVRQLKEELERRRRDETARARRDLERECAALVDALLDDVIARVARDEYETARRDRRPSRPEEALDRRRRDPRPARPAPSPGGGHDGGRAARRPERHHVRGKLVARQGPPARAPRRIYQKSEIREGDKCIEILEILEYASGSRSSPETSPSDESAERGAHVRRSRIPVPVAPPPPPPPPPPPSFHRMRLTGGEDHPRPPLDLPVVVATPACAAPPIRSRSNSLRFRRVFDMIPEERSSLGFESPELDADESSPRRGSGSGSEAGQAQARVSTRSAGTSPPAPAERRRVRSRTTMTSPPGRSAATSPQPPPPPPRPPRAAPAPPREGSREGDESSGLGMRRARPAGAGAAAEEGSSSSGDSSGSLLCSLAPRWLSAHARRARRHRSRRDGPASPPPSPPGGWSVTVAGSCRAALPADVEMRLRFPPEHRAAAARGHARAPETRASTHQECGCAACVTPRPNPRPSGAPALPPALAPAPAPARSASRHDCLTLTMKKEAQDSSIVKSTRSMRKSAEQLPDLETYRASRAHLKTSVKTRRGYSLHCWLPDDEPAPIRANNGLSVLGCAIIPELKPRVPTMSERDLTRVYTPRHYLRS